MRKVWRAALRLTRLLPTSGAMALLERRPSAGPEVQWRQSRGTLQLQGRAGWACSEGGCRPAGEWQLA